MFYRCFVGKSTAPFLLSRFWFSINVGKSLFFPYASLQRKIFSTVADAETLNGGALKLYHRSVSDSTAASSRRSSANHNFIWNGCEVVSEKQAQDVVQAALDALNRKIQKGVQANRERLKLLRTLYGTTPVGQLTVNSIVGGMRGVTALLTETSLLDAEKGIMYRGKSIDQCLKELPCFGDEAYPQVEGVIWLLLTGSVPSVEEAKLLSEALQVLSCISDPSSQSPSFSPEKSHFIPPHTFAALDALPSSMHPMSQLIVGVTSLQPSSRFAAAYQAREPKDQLWKADLYDALSLIAKNAVVAARIYHRSFRSKIESPPSKPGLDWAANFAYMLGFPERNHAELFRLYLLLHADHEGGNVSAHAANVVGSALSDVYLSFAAGMAGLAGPLHGLANQECLDWLKNAEKQLGGEAPTRENISKIARHTLEKGQVIPGYGHAVLRVTDPRFVAQRQYALNNIRDDRLFQLLNVACDTIPQVLIETGKVKNPYPNVDCHSGVLLQHIGLKESSFYTVLFGVSRAIGIAAQHVWNRALLLPIERPKSISLASLESLASGQTQ